MQPTYYVRHPEDSYEVADPQPVPEYKPITQANKYTHQKKPYRATALQYREDNREDVLSFLKQNLAEAHEYGEFIMIRFGRGRIDTIGYGSWLLVGEDGQVRSHGDEEFSVKYEELK